MQTKSFLRTLAAVTAAGFLAACSNADNPYASIKDPPLLKAKLHTVTIQVTDESVVDLRVQAGYTRMPPAPNYPGAARVEAALWKVPEDVAAAPVVVVPPAGQGASFRYLVMPPNGPRPDPYSDIVSDFYEKVLGDDVFHVAGVPDSATQRLLSLSYLVDDILAARNKLQEARIPITFSPVAITTAHFGDHKLLGITAPDGVIIELVETAAQ